MHVSYARAPFRLVLAVLLTLPVLALLPGAPAVAAAAGPTGLSPDSTTVNGTPVFSWDPVTNASSYDVEVWDGQPGVGTKVAYVSNTVNKAWVPTVQLPTGHTLTWQVRALVGGVDTDWSQGNFIRAAVSAPGLVAPVGGQNLDQPGNPLLYRWTAVPGATTYTVDVSLDSNFVSGVSSYTTSATQYSPNVIPQDGHYYWRVTATLSSGVKSDRSQPEDYTVTAVVRSGGSDQVALHPQYPADGQTVSEVEDVVLDWNPIDGASSYDVQVSTDMNFPQQAIVEEATVKSTRYSPPITLDNDQYWWRVAPINASGYQTPWGASTPTWTFTRHWPDQAHLQYPSDGATVGNPFYFQWSAVPLASRYLIDLSPNLSFTPLTSVQTCSTVHTTYTPSQKANDCWPTAPGTYYWRVRAYDDPAGVVSEAVNGEVHSFTYNPPLINQLTPEDGATVTVPTLSWEPYPNADSYQVTLTNMSNSTQTTKTTVGTTMTWPTKLTGGVTYKWQVRPVFNDGRIGASLFVSSQRSFTAQDPGVASALSPEPLSAGPAAVRPPILTWTPVAEATSYTVQVRQSGTLGWVNLAGSFAYPSGNDTTGVRLSPGTYEWKVIANGGANDGTLSSSTGTYTILPFGTVGNYRAALTGNDSGAPQTSCTATLPSACQNLRQTPLLRWDPVEGAAWYRVTIANDVNLTNQVAVVNVRGTNVWMDPAALPDANAGTAYYWDVVPCGPTDVCAPQTAATHQFNKTGLQVQLGSPADNATMANDITFTWQDYLATLQAADGSTSSLSNAAATEARQYRIQVDDNADFSSPLDTQVVDQTTYTPFGLTYPEQPLYWRVQAIDGSGNSLPWSNPRTVTKSSPPPVLNSPPTFCGSIALGWDPLFYAKTYTVQVFPSGANPDLATPLLSASSLKQNAYTPSTVLAPGDYIYRVRRADADGRPGAWSDTGSFTSNGSAPTLLGPADNASLPPKFGLFTWQPASTSAPVASWRIALTRSGGSTITVTTASTAYAPTSALADGTWTWTVTALGSTGAAIGQTAPRQFVVNGTLTPGTVTITGDNAVGSLLTINPLSWNVQPDSVSYQWYSGTSAVAAPGGTGSTYTVAAADAGKAIKVKITGYKDGYNSGGGTYSNTIAVAGTTTGGTGGTGGTTTTAKVSSQTTATLARKKIRKRKRGLVTVQVSSSVTPSGTVRVFDRSRLLATVTLSTASGGRISVRLPRLKVGRHPIWAQYLGNTQILGSSSGRVTLRVVR